MRKIILTWLALCAALLGAWQLSALDIPHFKSAHIERLLVTLAHAQLSMTGAGASAPSNGGAESYQWLYSEVCEFGSSPCTITGLSIPAGYIVVPATSQNAGIVSITIGSTALNPDATNSNGTYVYSGAVATSSTAVTIATTGFTGDFTFGIYVISNITTPSVKQAIQFTGSSDTISVSAGDFMFAANSQNSNYTSSTQTPTNKCLTSCVIAAANGTYAIADWLIASTNASFNVGVSAYTYNAVATYH
jgi:hypothetical protein